MDNNGFMKGRDSLLQTLAMLKDEEEFQAEFGGFEEEMETRREKTVVGLCAIVARLKTAAEIKKQCVDSLEDVNKCWRVIQEERGKLQEKIAELERDKKVLEMRVRSLEEEVKDLKTMQQEQQQNGEDEEEEEHVSTKRRGNGNNSSSNSSLYHTALRGSSDDDDEGDEESRHNNENNDNSGGEGFDLESQNNHFQQQQQTIPFYKSRFDEFKGTGGAGGIMKSTGDTSSSSSTQKPNFNYPLLTGNPYENLDRDHYNPTQFFQRQSSTFKRNSRGRGGRGGGRGGGKRKAANNNNNNSSNASGINSEDGNSTKKTKRGTGGRIEGDSSSKFSENSSDLTIISSSKQVGNGSPAKEPSEENDPGTSSSQPKEFPEDDSSFFDYTATIVADSSDYLLDV